MAINIKPKGIPIENIFVNKLIVDVYLLLTPID